jgi:hypothetical protein
MSFLLQRTICEPLIAKSKINFKHKLVSLGSCFSENIGKKFEKNNFDIIVNPYGQQYNPHSIATSIVHIINNKVFIESDLFYYLEQYHSFQHHSILSGNSVAEALANINTRIATAHNQMMQADYLFVTLGTAHIFTHVESNTVVNNCHKVPVKNFEKKYLKTNEIVQALANAFNCLIALNPTIKIVLTVSPVRYLAFGFYENNLSKGYLFSSIQELLDRFSCCSYFPAYELVMDDLRDYRYFSEDMLHPTYQATDYVWQKLMDTYLDAQTVELIQEINKINLAANHRPRNINSVAHQDFLKKTLTKAIQLETQYSFINFNKTKDLITSQMH